MIFGPNESSRRDLFFEKFSKGQNKQKYFKSSQKIFRKFSKTYLIIFLIQGGFSNRSPRLSCELLASADSRVRIEMFGTVDSLNVAVATGIVLHAMAMR